MEHVLLFQTYFSNIEMNHIQIIPCLEPLLVLTKILKDRVYILNIFFSIDKDPWRRKWQPTPVFLPGKSHGQRSLAGYSPWSSKELDMT